MGKMEENERKNSLMVNDYMLDNIFDKIKETIGIVKFDDTKILIDWDEKLLNYVNLKNVVILITCIIKDDAKSYPQLFLEEVLCNE